MEWFNFKTTGGPSKAGTYLVSSSYTKDMGQARWKPRVKEWKFPSAALGFEITHWGYMPSPPSDIK